MQDKDSRIPGWLKASVSEPKSKEVKVEAKEEKPIRVIKIDATAKTVTEETVSGDTLDAMQKIVGGYIEIATDFPNEDTLFVNEEGLMHGEENFFDIGAHQPFAGNGVITSSSPSGKTTSAKSTVEEIKAKVKFMGISEVGLMASKKDKKFRTDIASPELKKKMRDILDGKGKFEDVVDVGDKKVKDVSDLVEKKPLGKKVASRSEQLKDKIWNLVDKLNELLREFNELDDVDDDMIDDIKSGILDRLE